MKTATLGILEEGDTIILAEKKIGEIGIGVLSGPGGKLEEGETLEACLIRETREEWEIELDPDSLTKIARVTFFAAGEADFDVHIFRVVRFTGELKETADAHMPERFPRHALPYERMYEGDCAWFSKALSGEAFCANVYYKDRAKTFDRIEFFPPDF